MTQEDIKSLSSTSSVDANVSSSAASEASSQQQETTSGNYFEAFNLNIKTKQEVEAEFTEELGFDPYDIDQMAEHSDAQPVFKENITNLMELQQAMSVMLIERFQKNMEAFKKYIPNIYEQFHEYKPQETLEFMCTSNGIPNLFFPERNEFFYKTYDPEALCKKQVDTVLEHCPFRQLKYSIDKEYLGQIHHRYLNEIVKYQNEKVPPVANPLLANSCPIAILMGIGLGYHVGYLYERIEVGNLVLIEPNTDLFFASLHTFDWANLLEFVNENHRGIFFMVGQTRDYVFEDLNAYYGRHGRMLAGFMWSMVHYRSKEINDISDRLIEDYERSYATLGFFDDHLFAVSHGIHHIMDKVHFMKRGALKDEYINTPICIVANGPSLSHDLPFLRKVQDKVFIFACGTALETLYNAGIRPHFYGCTERLKVVSEHLSIIPDQDFVSERVLVAGDVVHPDVTKMFKHTAIFGKADENFFWLAAAKLYDQFRHVAPVSLMNPLVGNLGVSAITQMGFKNVYLFGVDNGTKRKDLMTHPDENLFYNDISIKKREKQEEEEAKKTGKPWRIVYLTEAGGSYALLGETLRVARELIVEASAMRRTPCPLSKLAVAVKCGTSDATSGIAGNPCVGAAFDRIVKAGGTAFWSETTEIIGAEDIVAARAASPEVSAKILAAAARWEEKARSTGEDIREINPIPANIAAGISTLEEKSLGAIAKSGSCPIEDVLDYGEQPKGHGLYFIDSWMSSLSLPLCFAASGAALVLYQMGGGAMPNHPMMPAINPTVVSPFLYVTGNALAYSRSPDNFDFDSSAIMTKAAPIDDEGERLLDHLIDIASGTFTKMETLDYAEQLEVFMEGPVL